MFKNHHRGDWHYEQHGRDYLKIGPHDMDDVEYKVQEDGSVFIPEVERYFTTLEKAYTTLNAEWVKNEWDT